jgi:hypothetical protein
MMGKRGVRDMISKKKIAATTFGALALATVFALTAARVASHSASAEPWFGHPTKEATASIDRRLEREEFYREYVCDHACRYNKY